MLTGMSLLLQVVVDHRKNGSALNVENKKVVVKVQEILRNQQMAGTFIVSGKTDPHCEISYLILKSLT